MSSAEEDPAPVDPRTLGPPMDPAVARVESAIEQAVRRGDFDDLPGAGRPLDLPAEHDPDWWINQRLADGTIDREALLPVVVLLRKEYQQREETLAELPTARTAREYAEDYTRRVHEDRRRNPFQTMLAPAWDGDEAVRHWQELRTARTDGERTAAPEAAAAGEAATAGEAVVAGEDVPHRPADPRRRRRWWPFGRRS